MGHGGVEVISTVFKYEILTHIKVLNKNEWKSWPFNFKCPKIQQVGILKKRFARNRVSYKLLMSVWTLRRRPES